MHPGSCSYGGSGYWWHAGCQPRDDGSLQPALQHCHSALCAHSAARLWKWRVYHGPDSAEGIATAHCALCGRSGMPIWSAQGKRLGSGAQPDIVLHMAVIAHRYHRPHNMFPARPSGGKPLHETYSRTRSTGYLPYAVCFGALHRTSLWRYRGGRTVPRTEEYSIGRMALAGLPRPHIVGSTYGVYRMAEYCQ